MLGLLLACNGKNGSDVDSSAMVATDSSTAQLSSDDAWELVWSDEFESETIDLDKWTFQEGNGCPNLCGWGNNELEYYTDRPENAFMEDGHLVIQAQQEDYEGASYTSAKLISRGKGDFQFGRIEMRAKLPEGQGIWPAFWMLPTEEVYGGWAASGEIDIMEMVGHEPNTVHGTVHYNPVPSNQHQGEPYEATSDLSEEFHTYGITWQQDSIHWWFDDTNFFTVRKGELAQAERYPFNEKFYLILNLAVGGNWPGSPDTTTQFPQEFVVDYVRVYQQKP
uniref:Glycoside hydrolase family 16 protein n=1 Tax=Roseihalotalea indica TaxID=2867963 RepID=A0AA49PYQ6_9BACT|nr:glycoside hydrolase family 16 protein [Tunicatimonas sp. TK19036]